MLRGYIEKIVIKLIDERFVRHMEWFHEKPPVCEICGCLTGEKVRIGKDIIAKRRNRQYGYEEKYVRNAVYCNKCWPEYEAKQAIHQT